MKPVDTFAAQRDTSAMIERMRIALVGPVAQGIPPAKSGSVETHTALLAEGLVARGHDVTLFATGTSRTAARLHPSFPRGYHEDPDLWPWELCELLNLASACERGCDFDVIHYQAQYVPISLGLTGLSKAPILTTVHYAPAPNEVALWARASAAAVSEFVALSEAQRELLHGMNVAAVIPHAVDVTRLAPRGVPEAQLVFLGRFTEGKGVLQAIEVARRTGLKLVLAAAANEYYTQQVAPLVDGQNIVYAGELELAQKADLLARSAALLYPVQAPEPFGLVMPEAMACGTPVAALDLGAVREVVDAGVTGEVFATLDELVAGLPRVLALDRGRVRARAVERFAPDRMIDAHVRAYSALVDRARARVGA